MGKKNIIFAIFIIFFILLISCTSSKKILYFQHADLKQKDSVIFNNVHFIQQGDIVEIAVTSAEEKDYVHFSRSGFRLTPDQAAQNAYAVDSSGIINLPYLGELQVAGMTTTQLRETITTKLTPFLKSPSVNVRILNLKISILGEVTKPGIFQISDVRIALPEALSLAGDLTIMAKRNDVLIIREENSLRSYTKIDLRDTSFLSSPYYYLRPNDIVYVEPSKSRIAQNDTRRWQVLAFATTVISLLTILVSRL